MCTRGVFGYASRMRNEQLRELVQAAGPFVSVHLDASHDTEDAARQAELRWQAIRSDLTSQGADERTISAVGRVLSADPPPVGEAGRAVIAAGGEVLADEQLPIPPAQPITRFGDLPYLVPLLAAARPPLPHVVVVVDRVGGRYHAVDRAGETVESDLVRGRDRHVHHVAGGGWAHGSMENRAEEIVRQNMREVADRVVHLVAQVNAELLVVAGDVTSRSDLVAALPKHVQRMVTELDVNANAEPTVLSDAIQRLLAQAEATEDAELLDRLRAGTAHGTASQGLESVTEALRFGQVETLLVTDPTLDDRVVHVGDDRTQVTTDTGTTDTDGRTARADEALPVAAIATAADVRVLTGGESEAISDGVAALLRFTV